MLTAQGLSHSLKLFLRTVISEEFASLAVLCLGVGLTFSGKFRKSDFVPQRTGSHGSNRSEVSANVIFLAKLSNKGIYF
jgi:hypothetical protein